MKESKVIVEFQEEARLETQRDAVLKVLDARFGQRAREEFAPVLRAETDAGHLDRLLRLAAKATTVKQFRERFAKA